MTTIQELARSVGFRGPSKRRTAEPGNIQTVQPVDNSLPTQSNVRTSVDCYVAGQYVQRNGNVIEVTQRYTIFVAYSRSTQAQTMRQVNDRIIQDFEARYGGTFNVTTVHVPDLPVPRDELPGTPPGGIAPIEMYGGTGMFRSMTKYERARTEIGTERTKARINIGSIRKRYGLSR